MGHRRRIMADEAVKTAAPAGGVATSDAPASRPDGGGREGGPREGGPREGGPRGPRPGGRPGGGPGGPREGGRKFFRRKKVCKFCVEKIDGINYKDVRLLSQFVAESGKIVPRRLTGVCTPHQRRLTDAIKQARNIALLPFGGR
jgi:small subunit ribosomal protein S18